MKPTNKQLKILRWLNEDGKAHSAWELQRVFGHILIRSRCLTPLTAEGLIEERWGEGYVYQITQAGIDYLKELDNRKEGK